MRDRLTGVVLCGGQSRRMGGADKGLLRWTGQTLAHRVASRLALQCRHVAINANRHAGEHATAQWPVWPDAPEHAGFLGPLAGFARGLHEAQTPWVLFAPCDAPDVPLDLAARLWAALKAHPGAQLAMPATPHPGGGLQWQPVFALMARPVAPSLDAALAAGVRKVEDWAHLQGLACAPYGDAQPFRNINTPQDALAPDRSPHEFAP